MIECCVLPDKKLRILHVLGTPVGDLFRHVLDLVRAQIARGHDVGLVVDGLDSDQAARAILADLELRLPLGLLPMPMGRGPRSSDLGHIVRLARHARRVGADVVHGHGSKGGVYARASGVVRSRKDGIRCYTPHDDRFERGNSSFLQSVHASVERFLARHTDLLLFESVVLANRFHARFGEIEAMIRIVRNGLQPDAFAPITPDLDAADFVCVGDLRQDGGVDRVIDALAIARRRLARPVTLVIVGEGPRQASLEEQARSRGMADTVHFSGALPEHRAFALGRILVVPGRTHSLPYAVLEAAAAQIPIVAIDGGGIGEAFGPYRDGLAPCDDPIALATAMEHALEGERGPIRARTRDVAAYVRSRFTVDLMSSAVLAGYEEAVARRQPVLRLHADILPIPS